MTPELDAVWWLGPDIRLASRCLAQLWPEYATEDQIAADLTLYLLDHDRVLEIEAMPPGGSRAWYLMIVGAAYIIPEIQKHKEALSG